VQDGELAVETGGGRGNGSLYRLTVEKGVLQDTLSETVSPRTPFPSETASPRTPFPQNGVPGDTLSGPERVSPATPIPPPFPPTPPLSTQNTSLRSSSVDSGPELRPPVRPLSGPQQAVAAINAPLREAGIPLPTPSQIAGWINALGG